MLLVVLLDGLNGVGLGTEVIVTIHPDAEFRLG